MEKILTCLPGIVHIFSDILGHILHICSSEFTRNISRAVLHFGKAIGKYQIRSFIIENVFGEIN